MKAWTSTDLSTLDRTGEITIATRRADGTLRTARIVWVVRHGDAFSVRSVNGRDVDFTEADDLTLRLDPA